MKNIIYKIENKTNHKIYIGQTTQGLDQRKREHFYRFRRGERDHKLYLAFRKYGFDNFEFSVICSVLNPDYLNDLEIEFIAQYNSFHRGYNMNIGGNTVSESTKEKLRAMFKGRKISWIDKIVASRKMNYATNKTLKYHLLEKDGLKFVVHNLHEFCRENGVDPSNLHHTRYNGRKTKGYSLLESSTTSIQYA